MTGRPLFNQVLVIPITEVSQKSRISLPASMKERPMKGCVVAVGPGKFWEGKYYPSGLKKGDTVYFRRYAGDVVEEDGTHEVILIADDDVLWCGDLDIDEAIKEYKNNEDNSA